MEDVVAESIARPRFNTLLLSIFGAVAMVLAAVGIYGVMAYSVTQRTHEIGIRMALGAERRQILGMIVGQGLVLTAVGIGVGIIASLALTGLIEKLLFGVSASDVPTLASVSLVLAAVAVVATLLPARRATTVDPLVALRHD
jgi:putative ABC transport system permease protein